MRHLSTEPARPRRRFSGPQYPTLAALVALSAAACGGARGATGSTASSAGPVVAIPTSQGPAGSAQQPVEPTGPPDPKLHTLTFPEDEQKLSSGFGCAGDCPPPWELAIGDKDRAQLEARVEYCFQAARKRHAGAHGNVSVHTTIGEDGKSKGVAMEVGEGVPAQVEPCVRKLVGYARFTARPGYERTGYASKTFEPSGSGGD